MTRLTCLPFCLLPNDLEQLYEESIQSLVDHYNDDLPQPNPGGGVTSYNWLYRDVPLE